MTFYWVNIGTSHKEVKQFEFLWAPAYSINKNGSRTVNAGWKAVPNVKKGDVLFCYANTEIIYVAQAKNDAYKATRPENRVFKEWAPDGFKVDVNLNVLDVPLNSKDFSQEFISLYNNKTIPKLFASDGRPSQQYMILMPNSAGAFLLDQLDNLSFSIQQALSDNGQPNSAKNKTTQEAIVKARIGQGQFRKDVLELWDLKCPVTGIDRPELLVASHIHSWQLSNDKERLDKYNGLPLSPDLDKLFDRGLISFSHEGLLIKHASLDPKILKQLGVPDNGKLVKVFEENLKYFEKHRQTHGYADF